MSNRVGGSGTDPPVRPGSARLLLDPLFGSMRPAASGWEEADDRPRSKPILRILPFVHSIRHQNRDHLVPMAAIHAKVGVQGEDLSGRFDLR
jgi:hypothetical protein